MIVSGRIKTALIGICLFLPNFLCENNEDEPEIKLERQDSCSFYCFMLPKKRDSRESIQKNIDALENLNCTHLVYGYATIDHYQKIHDANNFDNPLEHYWGNYRKLHRLHDRIPKIKLLLAVREQIGVHFIDSSSTRQKVIANLIDHADRHYFDGLFLNLHDTFLNSLYFQQFTVELKKAAKEQREKDKKQTFKMVLAVNSRNAFYTSRKLKTYADKFDNFYLKGDEPLSAESDVTTTIVHEPFHTDSHTHFEDVVSEAALSLVRNGIPEDKIIVGLSSWARGYSLVDRNSTYHGAYVYEYARLKNSKPSDGRFAYQEICQLNGAQNIEYWNKSAAVSFVDDDDNWFSFNLPDHESLARKVRYIMTHGFGGIGVMQLEADDPNNECGKGPYPLNKFVSDRLKCSKKKAAHGGTTECKRMCIYRPERGQISFQTFKAEWCSHLVISSLKIEITGAVSEPPLLKSAIIGYNTWSARKKPFLVVSIGAEVDGLDWQEVLRDETKRTTLIQSTWQFYADTNADGLSIDFIQDPIGGTTKDKEAYESFNKFLLELRQSKPRNAVIFVTVTFSSTVFNAYNATKVNEAADYIIIDGYHFHHPEEKFTGHHSPLFMNKDLVVEGLRSIEGMADSWTKMGIPHNKVIIGFSAAGITMPIIKNKERADDDEWKFLGLTADLSDVGVGRSNGPGFISQTELCEELSDKKATHQFIPELGVPVAKKGEEFFAYDDARSIQTKAIWASLNHFAGVSLHAIEMDNPTGVCPSNEPFNLLQKIVHTQACEVCVNPRVDESFMPENKKCKSDTFRVICNYRLPSTYVADDSLLSPTMIPFEKCSEIVVEEMLWTGGTVLTFRNMPEQVTAHNLMMYSKQTPEFHKKIYLIINCAMTKEEMKAQMDTNHFPTTAILEKLDQFGFSGVELRCDQALSNETKDKFKEFVDQLTESFQARKSNNKCAETVSIRIPIWNSNLTEKYDLDQLNAVHQVVLETFERSSSHSQVISPLFRFDMSNETHAIDTSIANWIEIGIHRQNIIMQVPSYGLIQTYKNESAKHSPDDEVNEWFKLVSQQELCQMFNETSGIYQKHLLYDMVSAYSTSNNQWISYETNETITYKVKFAIREGLGGIGLLTVNQDDYNGVCQGRKYPLLNAIHSSICTTSPMTF